jgi:hypothetical protein
MKQTVIVFALALAFTAGTQAAEIKVDAPAGMKVTLFGTPPSSYQKVVKAKILAKFTGSATKNVNETGLTRICARSGTKVVCKPLTGNVTLVLR